jgi:hypothetical protein
LDWVKALETTAAETISSSEKDLFPGFVITR